MELKNKSLFKQECFIGGKWVKSLNNDTIQVDNPATLKSIGNVPKCGKEETKNAIEAANDAFLNWKNKTAKERSIILKQWQDLIIKNVDDLAHIMTVEQGKPLAESKGEILMGASYIEFYAEEVKRVYGDIIPDPLPDR